MDRYLTAIFGGLLFLSGITTHITIESLWYKQVENSAMYGVGTMIIVLIAICIYIANIPEK